MKLNDSQISLLSKIFDYGWVDPHSPPFGMKQRDVERAVEDFQKLGLIRPFKGSQPIPQGTIGPWILTPKGKKALQALGESKEVEVSKIEEAVENHFESDRPRSFRTGRPLARGEAEPKKELTSQEKADLKRINKFATATKARNQLKKALSAFDPQPLGGFGSNPYSGTQRLEMGLLKGGTSDADRKKVEKAIEGLGFAEKDRHKGHGKMSKDDLYVGYTYPGAEDVRCTLYWSKDAGRTITVYGPKKKKPYTIPYYD